MSKKEYRKLNLHSKITSLEEEHKSPDAGKGGQLVMVDVVEEERKLMEGSRNLENKDDFWITLSQ
jgi:hypothetical protein